MNWFLPSALFSFLRKTMRKSKGSVPENKYTYFFFLQPHLPEKKVTFWHDRLARRSW